MTKDLPDEAIPDKVSPPRKVGMDIVWLKAFMILLLVLWTAVVGLSFVQSQKDAYRTARAIAVEKARTAFERDVVYRRWNAQSVIFGIESQAIPANPYLPAEGRSIPTDQGFTLTRINPAYMTRLVHEFGLQNSGDRGHITSLNPIRPANKPDQWEADSLRLIEAHTPGYEVTEVLLIDEKPYMRFMAGLVTEESCIPCHPDYMLGSIRGGISIDIPMDGLLAEAGEATRSSGVYHFGIWLAGLLLLSSASRKIGISVSSRDKANIALEEENALLRGRMADKSIDTLARENILQSFVDNIDAGVFMKNTRDEFIFVNRIMAGLLRKDEEQIIGLPGTASHLPFFNHVIECEHTVIQTGTSMETEVEYPVAGEDPRPYRVFLFPLFSSDRTVDGVGGFVLDISQRKNLEKEMLEARIAADRARQASNDFLSNISHEIRTPLNGIIGMADMLGRTTLTADQSCMASVIKGSGDVLLAKLNDVVDFSKLEAGRVQLDALPFNFRDMIFSTAKGAAAEAGRKGVEVLVNISPEIPEQVVGDPARIAQILCNLLDNSVKFTDRGEITIFARQLQSTFGRTALRISVTDTGSGIPDGHKALIFKEAGSTEGPVARRSGGSGLGLAISARLADLMQGRLSFESLPGSGSTFWLDLDLPCLDDPYDPAAKSGCDQLQGLHILAVNGNASARDMVSGNLAPWGVRVTTRTGFEEGLKELRGPANPSEKFNLVFVDGNIPDNGASLLAKTVREDPALSGLPIILLTSSALPEDGEGQYFSAVLNKPASPEELIRALCAAMGFIEKSSEAGAVPIPASLAENRILRILLVEDTEMNQLVAYRMLTELGHEVTVAENGQRALDILDAQTFDLVFMDVQMPVLDGVAATRKIREAERDNGSQEHLPIIAMTAHALEEDEEHCLEQGMDGYLAKPVTIKALTEAIRNISGTFNLAGKARTGPASPTEPGQGTPGTAALLSPPEETVLQADALTESFAGNTDLARQSMTIYIRTSAELLENIRKALDNDDNQSLASGAHVLKGITGYYTRGPVYQNCVSLEKAGRNNGLPLEKEALLALCESIRSQVGILQNEMREYIKAD